MASIANFLACSVSRLYFSLVTITFTRQYTHRVAKVPAVKNNRIYSLPAYIDSSVIECEEIFVRRAQALDK